VSIYDAEQYLNSQNSYYRAYAQVVANKWQIALPKDGIEALEMYKKTNICQIGLQFAQRFDNHKVAMENSLISTGAYTYNDATLSSINLKFEHTLKSADTPWSNLDDATPLSDIEKILDIYTNNIMIPGAIFMGKEAARNFIKNKKEVINTQVQMVGASIIVQSPEVDIEKARQTKFDPYAGYQEIGSYRGIPIFMISKEVAVPTDKHNTMLVETFDTNSVSFVAFNDNLLNKNFLSVHRELNYMGDNGVPITERQESVAYFGKVDDTQKRQNFYCESTYAPVLLNDKALVILNVG
jgi:hypothetical protein